MSLEKCKHELLVQECSLCNGKVKYDLVEMSAWFTAKYNARCMSCHDPIEEGDTIRYMSDVIVCEYCGRD
jgi:hypothetical protein